MTDLAFLEGRLSARAMAMLARLGAHRDPTKTCDRKELVQALRARSRPVSNAILELEEAVGGLVYGSRYIGVYAAMQSGRTGDCASYEGIPVAPIYLTPPEQGGDDQVYVDAQGRIYRTDTIALGGVIADSWTFYVERDARTQTFRIPGAAQTLHVTLHEVMVGDMLARTFDAAPLAEASDSRERIWEAPGVRICETEELIDFGFAGTHVSSDSDDAIVGALQAAHAAHPELLVRFRAPRSRSRRTAAARPPGEPILVVVRLHPDMGTRPVGRLSIYREADRYVFVEE